MKIEENHVMEKVLLEAQIQQLKESFSAFFDEHVLSDRVSDAGVSKPTIQLTPTKPKKRKRRRVRNL